MLALAYHPRRTTASGNPFASNATRIQMATVFLLAPLESPMPTARRTSTLPLPGAELERLKTTLSRSYGAQAWDGAGERILVVRVPRGEPDVVNDLEEAVEHVAPADVEGITAALLVGDDKTLAVPVHPFSELMAQRVRFDHEQCTQLRKRLGPGTHLTYRAPGDPRKVLRLGLRVGHKSVQDVGDADLEHWATTLGADLDAGRFNGTRAVYLVADQDEVRIDAALFFHDLRKHAADAKARRDMAAQVAARQAPAKPKAERVAYAPLRSIEATPLEEPVVASYQEESPAAVAPAVATALPTLDARLKDLGFDTMVRPPGHAIDLAAERPEGDPQRVIAWTPERLTPEVATQALGTARKLDVDLALVVCEDAEPEGRKRLIATKVRWIQPKDIAQLDL